MHCRNHCLSFGGIGTGVVLLGLILHLAGLSASSATLSGSFTPLPLATNIDLTAEGNLDWAHWGLTGDWTVSRKYGVARQITHRFISDAWFTYGPWRHTESTTTFNWQDGGIAETATNTPAGVFIVGDKLPGNVQTGFRLQCLAGITPKILRIYVGSSGAHTRFTASLSGASSYSDTSLSGAMYGVYTLAFQADTPGQVLTVNFLYEGSVGNLMLQAASLAGTNSPPEVHITQPADGSVFDAPAMFPLDAIATDSDGSVTNLMLLINGTLLTETGLGWQNIFLFGLPVGAYSFEAVARDDSGLSRTSTPVNVLVTVPGGTLEANVAEPPAALNLDAEGKLDWVHWGLISAASIDRKTAVAPLIPNVQISNAVPAEIRRYADNRTAYSWTNGTPTPTAAGSTTGIFLFGTNDPPAGFRLSVPATNTLRRLKLYVGLYGAQAQIDAHLSDWSALPYTDSSLSSLYDNAYAVYSFLYASTNPGTTLEISWKPTQMFDANFGNVTWQAATLVDVPYTPVLRLTTPEPPSPLAFVFKTQAGFLFHVESCESLTSPVVWLPVTTIPGDGADAVVNVPPGGEGSLYRVRVE